ncbi:putative ubiquitin-like-specific protease 1B [Zea mays]|uniref:Putative ubiquitin-like-specific protease 1B n=1 Tax=Zea mays TaxID=4577 RepID=A0A3L6EC68_MAIZE|nr:putative ubiquitin-like-specific protease 1B [Zea mays]
MAAAAVTLLRLPLARLSYHLRSIEEESAAEAEAPRSFVLPPNLVSTFSDNLESNKLLKVFIPINIRETHLYLVVINAINMEIQVLDSLGTSQDRKDLTDSDSKDKLMISQRKELKDHRWPDLQVASWSFREIEMAYAKQTDSSSCGLFLLNYIEYWTRDELSNNFTQDDMSHFRKKLVAILLSSDLNKRRGVRYTIMKKKLTLKAPLILRY